MHLQVLRELFDATERLLSRITKRSWESEEVSEDCEKANATVIFFTGKEDPGKYVSVNYILFSGRWCIQLSQKPFPNMWSELLELCLKGKIVPGQSDSILQGNN